MIKKGRLCGPVPGSTCRCHWSQQMRIRAGKRRDPTTSMTGASRQGPLQVKKQSTMQHITEGKPFTNTNNATRLIFLNTFISILNLDNF